MKYIKTFVGKLWYIFNRNSLYKDLPKMSNSLQKGVVDSILFFTRAYTPDLKWLLWSVIEVYCIIVVKWNQMSTPMDNIRTIIIKGLKINVQAGVQLRKTGYLPCALAMYCRAATSLEARVGKMSMPSKNDKAILKHRFFQLMLKIHFLYGNYARES